MQGKLEKLVKIIYQSWQQEKAKMFSEHPDEETFVSFFEGSLSANESEEVKLHLVVCDRCADIFATLANLQGAPEIPVPQALITQAKDLVKEEENDIALEVALRIKSRMIELLHTTGDILVGQELIPSPVLRSRAIKNFKDEIAILKDFPHLRVEIKLENREEGVFDLTVVVKEKETAKTIKDLRVTLLEGEREIESYLSDSGKAIFEHVLLGKYTVCISNPEKKLATIVLDIQP